jgi:hypothetical protein
MQKHGDSAEGYADERAHEALQEGNTGACEAWKSVAMAICEMEENAQSNRRLN